MKWGTRSTKMEYRHTHTHNTPHHLEDHLPLHTSWSFVSATLHRRGHEPEMMDNKFQLGYEQGRDRCTSCP